MKKFLEGLEIQLGGRGLIEGLLGMHEALAPTLSTAKQTNKQTYVYQQCHVPAKQQLTMPCCLRNTLFAWFRIPFHCLPYRTAHLKIKASLTFELESLKFSFFPNYKTHANCRKKRNLEEDGERRFI